MRICMLIRSYWPAKEGGTERQCRRVARSMAAQGHDVTILTRRLSVRHHRREEDGSTVIIRLGALSPLSEYLLRRRESMKRRRKRHVQSPQSPSNFGVDSQRQQFLTWFAPIRWLCWWERLGFIAAAGCFFLRRRGILDVVHVHESHWFAGLGVWCGRLSQAKTIVIKEASFPVLQPIPRGVPFRLTWARFRQQGAFLALTDEARDSLVEHGIESTRVSLVPNGVAMPHGTANVSKNQNVLLVANLYQGATDKGLDVLFAAWRSICRQTQTGRLVVVGAGDRTRWEEYSLQHGMESRVEFLGFRRDPSMAYRDAAIFVLLSRREGMSNALLEAQSFGIPAVVSDIPGNRAVVKDKETGLIVPVGDVEATAAAVLQLLCAPTLRVVFGQAAATRIQNEFSLEAVADSLIRTYERMAR